MEWLNLFTTYGGKNDKAVLFRQIRIIRKKLGRRSDLEVSLKRRFTQAEYAGEYLRYRALRPLFNLRRSLRNRMLSMRVCLDALCRTPESWKKTDG
jgi:hypothetical protein